MSVIIELIKIPVIIFFIEINNFIGKINKDDRNN